MISEEDIIILLAALRISHQTHSAGLRTEILDDAYTFFHKIVRELLGQRKILTQDMHPAIRVYKALGDKYYSFVFLTHLYPSLYYIILLSYAQ